MNYGKPSSNGQDGNYVPGVGNSMGRKDAAPSRINIQDAFLNHCRREKVVVDITTINGRSCVGIIAGFDNVVIALEKDGCQQLVFKTAIMIINPVENVNYIFNEAYRNETYRHDSLRTHPEYANDFA